ncbi:hypothetical protein VTL71DRAFT_3980 [Oculimacula yallundae]|uniref:Apple domain-containing protein n=1 Tax=Oculimacula yallundae TaxID=86028 RepID=A0ABR4C598_9HELO
MNLIIGLLAGAALSSAAPQSFPRNVPEILQERGLPQCHSDNLYRIFIDKKYSSSASAFCSTYITATSISTIIPKATVTVTSRVTGATLLITNVVVATKTNTIPMVNPTITLTPKLRRDDRLEKCPGKAGTYAPYLISSACSCLVEPVSVVSRTTTAPIMTITEKNTLILTRSTTTVQSTTTTVDVTGPPKATETVHIPLPPVEAPVEQPVEQPVEAIPAYCTDGDYVAPGGGIFTPFCGFSFVSSRNLMTAHHADTYSTCADKCDENPDCTYFSFSLVLMDNCLTFIKGVDDESPPNADVSFDSGFRIM